jgi:Rod binding domain-containing protein
MEIAALQSQRPVDPSSLSLDRVAASKSLSEKQKVGAVSQAFEALLLHNILGEMQKPVFPSKYVGNSTTDGIYRDMAVTQLANSMAKSGGFGLAKSLGTELQRKDSAATVAPAQHHATKAHSTKPTIHE